jgi:hypothetical protein
MPRWEAACRSRSSSDIRNAAAELNDFAIEPIIAQHQELAKAFSRTVSLPGRRA